MSSLTFELPEEKAERLVETAKQMGMPVEALLQQITDEFLRRQSAFEEAPKYVLQKNAELYRRLAQ